MADDADVVNEASVIHTRSASLPLPSPVVFPPTPRCDRPRPLAVLREKLGKGSGGIAAITSASLAPESKEAKEAAAEDRRDMEELVDHPPPRRTALDHCSHLQHVALALAALGRDPGMAEVQAATPPDVLGKLRAMAAAAEAQAARGVPAGELGPAPPPPAAAGT